MNEAPLHIPTIRKALNLTQSQLADMAGVNLSTVWRWENEGIPKRGPARALLDRLYLEALRIPNSPASSSVGDDAGASVTPPAQLGAPAICEQGREEVSHRVHTPEIAGSNPVPATNSNSPADLPSGEPGARLAATRRAPAFVSGGQLR